MRNHDASGARRLPMRILLVTALLMAAKDLSAQVRPVEIPTGGKTANSTYSAAIDAGDYVYVSGQGGQRPDGSTPARFDEQAGQALENIKALVEAAGLSMKN